MNPSRFESEPQSMPVVSESVPAPGPTSVPAIVAVTLIGLLPLVTTPHATSDSGLEMMLWLALWAAPAGSLLSSGRLLRRMSALIVWAIAAAVTTHADVDASGPLASMSLAGFELVIAVYALAGLLAAWTHRRFAVAASTWLLALSLAYLPSFAGVLGSAPWSPACTARLLDLSPQVYVAERRGVDWLRDPRVYDAVGASSIGPDLRTPHRGFLAGWALLVLGCTSLACARHARSAHQE
ncbi:MAG: hypothetical protein ACI835_001805 [Planctomycetota bacterium]|jgi:hypothetical protein